MPTRDGSALPRRACAAAVLLCALALPAGAAAAQSPPPGDPRPEARAARAAMEVVLDGRPTEEAWLEASPITRFTQTEPDEGRPATEPVEVRILYDAEALYVGAWLPDSRPVSTRLARRDTYMRDSDWFSISLDTYHDHRTGWRLMVNPSGVRVDQAMSSGGAGDSDESWDPVWEAEAAVSDSGWTVEMRIPFSQLRFAELPVQTWGLQLERELARRQEEAVFAFTPRREAGGIARWGHLVGLESLRPGGRLELLPYAVARAEYTNVEREPGLGFGSPYRDGSDWFGGAGLDLKYRVTSNLTLDATVNPDFGQVEVDPAVVNLSAYETRFQEKRPFFVEGADIFEMEDGWLPDLLYSRRIGAGTDWDPPGDAVYHEPPGTATILAAAKLTGRTPGGWSLGLLEAVTDEETARYVDAAGLERSEVVAPTSNFLVARARRSFRDGRTEVGALGTSVLRRVDHLPISARQRRSAFTGGLDFRHESDSREWALTGAVMAGRIAGEPAAIARAQRSSARYFQRPDAGHVEYDPDATSLSGYAYFIGLSKNAGLHWRGEALVNVTSPGLETNDMGIQRNADEIEPQLEVRYEENRPGRTFREWSIVAEPRASWNFGGDYRGTEFSIEAQAELLSYWRGEIHAERGFPGLDDRLTRGGPLARGVADQQVSGWIASDSRKPLGVRVAAGYGWNEAGGRESRIRATAEIRPAHTWTLSLSPSLERQRQVAQYLAAVEDPTAADTFGRRYVFSGLDRTTVALETRLNVTFRPGLTLELYAQPFLASGDFGSPMELRAPETFDFVRYGRDAGTLERTEDGWIADPDAGGPAAAFAIEDEDFNRRSLRGNAVVRWEWRPGSTLYAVWQQSRSDRDGLGDFDFGRDARELFAAPPENIFILKASYWLAP